MQKRTCRLHLLVTKNTLEQVLLFKIPYDYLEKHDIELKNVSPLSINEYLMHGAYTLDV